MGQILSEKEQTFIDYFEKAEVDLGEDERMTKILATMVLLVGKLLQTSATMKKKMIAIYFPQLPGKHFSL